MYQKLYRNIIIKETWKLYFLIEFFKEKVFQASYVLNNKNKKKCGCCDSFICMRNERDRYFIIHSPIYKLLNFKMQIRNGATLYYTIRRN